MKFEDVSRITYHVLRILHLLHQYLPERTGGTEVYTYNLARQQARAGHSVAVFAPTAAPPTDEPVTAAEEEGVRVYRIAVGARGPGQIVLSTFAHRRLSEAFGQVLARERPGVAHVQHLMGLPASIAAQLTAASVPYVVTLWDFWWRCANAQLLTNDTQEICEGPDGLFFNCARCALARLGRPAFPPALPVLAAPLAWRARQLRPVLAQAARLIAPAEFVGRWYATHGAPVEKIVVVPPGLDVPAGVGRTGTEGNSGEVRGTQAGRPFRVGYVGGLSWQKGGHVLVEAFAGVDGELWVAGDMMFDPAYVARLRQLAGDKVTFLGRLDRAALWEMLAQVDVVAVPSLWYETFVFVVSEAFAAGVPVVASDLGVLAGRVRDGEDGLLVPAGDVAAWREALNRLRQEPGLLARLRANVPVVLTMGEHGRQIEGIYEGVMRDA